MNVDEYEPMEEAPSEQELATGAVTEGNNMNMSNNQQNNQNNQNNNQQNNQQNNKNNQQNNKNNKKNKNNQQNDRLNNQNNQGLPPTVNNVNANINEEQEPISYSREDELVKFGSLNGMEPTNLASRYHNIFNAEGKERKRSRKRKNRKSLKRKSLRRKTLKRK